VLYLTNRVGFPCVKILVTGSSGLLGGRLAQLLVSRAEVTAGRRDSPVPQGLPSVDLDVESAGSVAAALERARPDAVLHAAALATADACHRDPERARRINVDGSETLARACRERDIRLVALSTDLVFAGDAPFADESRAPSPLSTYGRTKLEAEDAVLAAHPRAAVARVALVLGGGFGPRGSASESIAWALRAGRRPTLFVDEYRTPVDAESLAPALAALLAGPQTGRFHLGGPERISRYELGRRVARALGLSPDGIDAARQSERPSPEPRPADVSLDSTRAQRELGYRPRTLEEAIGSDRIKAD
jgi:dTDP-4-dehydrorhamnose reductase